VRRFLFDTAVFVYAVGGPHPLQEPCRAIIERQTSGELDGVIVAPLLQEYVHQSFRQLRDRSASAASARDVAGTCLVLPATDGDAQRALELYERHPRLGPLDAVFAAVALNRGIDAILTPDRGFDGIPGLERVDPADDAAVAALAA
jgi:uncharacterized protein